MLYINPRSRRIRQKLADGLIDFVLEHGYQKLGVNALCRYAHVGHTTFYRHYKGMDDFIDRLLQDAADGIKQRMAQQSSPYDEFVAVWAFIQENERLFRFYIALPPDHPGRWVLNAAAEEVLTERFHLGKTGRVPSAVTVKLVIESIYQLILLYLKDTEAYSPDRMATFFLDIIIQPEASKAIELRKAHVLTPIRKLENNEHQLTECTV